MTYESGVEGRLDYNRVPIYVFASSEILLVKHFSIVPLQTWCYTHSYFVRLCGFYYEAFHVDYYLLLILTFLSVLFRIVTSSDGEERELV